MTPDLYLHGILAREAVDTSSSSPVWAARNALMPTLNRWGENLLQDVSPSGSFAKGTANRSGTDIDLFLSLASHTTKTLKEIYETLFSALTAAGFAPRRQNVSIGVRIIVGGIRTDVDLVPGKRQSIFSMDHSLYRRKADTWMKTNVQTHISHVVSNQRLMESRILKLWRTQKKMDFPSFYLELAVIDALQRTNGSGLASRVMTVLQYLAGDFATTRFVDPANGANIISDDLTAAEKGTIKAAAQRAVQARMWEDIVQ